MTELMQATQPEKPVVRARTKLGNQNTVVAAHGELAGSELPIVSRAYTLNREDLHFTTVERFPSSFSSRIYT